MLARMVRLGLTLLVLLILVGGPLFYQWHQRRHFRNFQVVREGVLYRSGQLSLDGLKTAIRDHGIKTVVSLRYAKVPGGLPPDADEEIYCRQARLNYFRIRPQSWSAPAGPAPAEIPLQEFRAIMDNPDHYPVLIHCFAGKHRTGSFCAVFRMDRDGWTNAEALAEMRHHGYDILDEHEDIHGFLLNYRPQPPRPVEYYPVSQP